MPQSPNNQGGIMSETKDGTIVVFGKNGELRDIVLRLGDMFREHMTAYETKIKELTDRIDDLEGHAEHGPDGTCGVCTPPDDDPETVGAGEYGTEIVADFDAPCADPFCDDKIIPGDDVVIIGEGKFLHDYCRR